MISTTAQISEDHSNSSLVVDELNGSQTNSISGEPVTTTNVLTDDIEEEAILKTGVDQKRHPDEDLSVIFEIDSTYLVNGNTNPLVAGVSYMLHVAFWGHDQDIGLKVMLNC